MRDESPAADLTPWHREIWSGTYRQWLSDQGGEDSWRADHSGSPASDGNGISVSGTQV